MNTKISVIVAAACVGAASAASYDLLGRQISKSASPLVFKTNAVNAKNAEMHSVLAKQSETKITPAWGRLEQVVWCDKTKKASQDTRYWFNDHGSGLSEYLNAVNKYEKDYAPRKNYNGSGEAHSVSNGSLLYSVGDGAQLNVNGDVYKEASRLEKNVTTSYKKIDMFSPWKFDLNYYYFDVKDAYKGRTGVYLVDDAAPYNASNDRILNKCGKNGMSKRQDSQFGALQSSFTLSVFSYLSDIYYYDYECDEINGKPTKFPVRPDTKNIHMGVHTNGLEEAGDGHYNDRAAYLDDYIYETRMIEVVAAGNLAKTPTNDNWNGYIRKTASALNAITVGSVESATGKVAAYNSWKNPLYVDGGKSYDKPEIYGYTNYFMNNRPGYAIKHKTNGRVFNYTPIYDGTETAATYIGGMVGALLSREPFYRWHPEVVKALLLTSSDIDVMPKDKNGKIDYHNKKFEYKKNNSNLVLGATDYRKVFAGNHSRYWIANNFDEIKTEKDSDGKPILTFKERLLGYEGKYRVAIAWLSKSSYAMESGRTPQDFDLSVLDYKGNVIAQSTTGDNPFELLEFTTDSYEVTIKIKLYRNDGERILLGYNLYSYDEFYQECTVGL